MNFQNLKIGIKFSQSFRCYFLLLVLCFQPKKCKKILGEVELFRRQFRKKYLKSNTTVVLFLFISPAFSVDKGMKEYKQNNFDEARKYYESVLEERKDDPAANFGLGVSAYQQGDIKVKQLMEWLKDLLYQKLNTTITALKWFSIEEIMVFGF